METGEALGPDHDGEICVKGPTVMKGFLQRYFFTILIILFQKILENIKRWK